MQELNEDKVRVDFMCPSCQATASERVGYLPYNGAPMCINEDCEEYMEEMDIDKVWLED